MLRINDKDLELIAISPYSWLEQISCTPFPEFMERRNAGQEFHLLMRQMLMGLPVEPILEENPTLCKWVNNLKETASYIFSPHVNFECEVEESTMYQGHLLTARYDLLILEQKAELIQWSTSPYCPDKTDIGQSWSTRLALYILGESNEYAPHDISISYWFVNFEKPVTLKFDYDATAHRRAGIEIEALLAQINARSEKPQRENQPDTVSLDWQAYLDDIEEIAI
jgi:hypothetical protein